MADPIKPPMFTEGMLRAWITEDEARARSHRTMAEAHAGMANDCMRAKARQSDAVAPLWQAKADEHTRRAAICRRLAALREESAQMFRDMLREHDTGPQPHAATIDGVAEEAPHVA